ncbi:MAG: hypothetical protein RID09_25105 [Coleofasciculus sp. G1-WW12-02]|uniref:hypothetical protein n=1 Tax=unclassified Coleofasciculus TaxID=2692782 RepID=UPI0032F6C248
MQYSGRLSRNQDIILVWSRDSPPVQCHTRDFPGTGNNRLRNLTKLAIAHIIQDLILSNRQTLIPSLAIG